MEKILNYYSGADEINYINSIFNFIVCVISSYLLKLFYERYSNSVIPKNTISRILPILSLITLYFVNNKSMRDFRLSELDFSCNSRNLFPYY